MTWEYSFSARAVPLPCLLYRRVGPRRQGSENGVCECRGVSEHDYYLMMPLIRLCLPKDVRTYLQSLGFTSLLLYINDYFWTIEHMH